MSVGFFGGSGMISIWISFTSCSVTSLATWSFPPLVSLSTLATSLWLKHCVLNMMPSSSAIWCSSSSTYWWNLVPIIDTFHALLPSFTWYFVEGNSIWCVFHGCHGVNSICGNAARYVWVGNQVLRNIFVPWDFKHAVKYPFGLVIFISSVACYGLSWNSVWNLRNWLGLIREWSSYGIYKASWNTRMYCRPITDMNPVASDKMSTSYGIVRVWKRRHITWSFCVAQYGAVATWNCCISVTVQFCSTMEWFDCVIRFMDVDEILRLEEQIGAMNRIRRSLFCCLCTILV